MALGIDGTTTNPTGSGTSIAVTLTTTLTNDIICVALTVNGASITSITDTAGLTFLSRARVNCTAVPADGIEFWYAKSAAALTTDVITINLGASAGFLSAFAFAISGADFSTIFDSNGSLPNLSAATPSDPRTVSTTSANTIILGFFRQGSQGSPTTGAGYTGLNNTNFMLVEYQIVSAAQTNLSVTDGTALDSNGAIGDAIMMASAADTLLGQACL